MIEIPKQAEGLIFDLDGTVANTMQNHFLSWRKAVMPYGVDFTAKLFKSLTGKPREATILKLNELFDTTMNPEEVGNVKAAHFKTLVDTTKEIAIVADVVRKYHNILPMSIGTGSTRNGAKKTLEVIEMSHFFDIVITANDIENPKPHPETFLKCAELMGVHPMNCVVFEDGILGIQAAKEAGMMVVDVNDYYKMEFTI
ncbi:phosphatase [Lutibacter profundi]|uniref:Phosphatase n=1 Tax=Lutibacter profundi TaxID=1622118 RepID=A0A0X8G7A9_9FLAO|nr:beta-phosphoglucomutase family hydrolase [Lutibacter profundi]AMC11354.1 phosphatase [Lutibacter profundi]